VKEITVVMTTYNGEAYVEEQLTSILKGDFKDFSIHVYDDGSTDGTRAILERYAAAYPEQVQIFFNPQNKGVIRNFMEGAALSDSPYLMFADQDDVWLFDKLKKSLAAIKKEEESVGSQVPVVVFTDATVVDENLSVLAASFHKSNHLNTKKLTLSRLLMENKVIGCTMIINRAMQKRLMPYPVGLRMHDWWIGLIGVALGRISYLPESTLLYRQHGKNVVGSKNFGNYVKKRVSALGEQRKALEKTEGQAAAFFAAFEPELSQKEKEVLKAFASLKTAGFFKKRYLLIRYGFWKTGVLRNIGVFLLI
jgi:glycosyltransferase involved in cell wall biosynthesis